MFGRLFLENGLFLQSLLENGRSSARMVASFTTQGILWISMDILWWFWHILKSFEKFTSQNARKIAHDFSNPKKDPNRISKYPKISKDTLSIRKSPFKQMWLLIRLQLCWSCRFLLVGFFRSLAGSFKDQGIPRRYKEIVYSHVMSYSRKSRKCWGITSSPHIPETTYYDITSNIIRSHI